MKLGIKIKKTLNIKFHSMPVYDLKYIKTKVKELNGVVNTNFCASHLYSLYKY